ncbi:LacI family DNA-binding transcriptional regulator [Litorimonas sp. RW-G-Af-16]|uniref:LacI family DNA-binding transcriptional regulator n=1 Tax=Litorimonas sp. RW-G-Af-16 TaxID=3241168 RepID=UPI003AAC64CB
MARIAGVSIATVSRALNDSPSVNEQTKREIWKLAREHGYNLRPTMPTSLERANATISIIIPPPQGREGWLRDPFFQELIGAVGEAARDRKCDLLISHAAPQNYDDLSRLLELNHSEGVIILGQSFLHERLNRLVGHPTKFVVWGGDLPGQRYCSVGTDNVRGGKRATAHLLRLGRRRIAFFGDTEAPEIGQRFDGYRQALEEKGLKLDENLVSPAHFKIESAEVAVDALVASQQSFDAIFASSDLIALGAIRALQRHGISVPRDVSVVGYDDVQLARYNRPALTTIRQDLSKAGSLMVAKLLNASHPQDMVSERLPTDLIMRESCGG